MEIEIEEITDLEAAWPEVAPLLLALHEHHTPITGIEMLDEWEERQRSHIATGEDALILIARTGDRAIGFVNAQISHNPGILREHFGFIHNMYVDAELRGEGLGRRLLNAIEDWCRSRNVGELRLNVVVANVVGVAVWRATGFSTDSYRMSKRLD